MRAWTMSDYQIHFIAFGSVKDGHCIDAQEKLNELLADGREMMQIDPFMLIAPGQPLMDSGNNIVQMAPRMIPGFTVITKTEE